MLSGWLSTTWEYNQSMSQQVGNLHTRLPATQLTAQWHESGCTETVLKWLETQMCIINPEEYLWWGREGRQGKRESRTPFHLPPTGHTALTSPHQSPLVKMDPHITFHSPPHYREEIYLSSFFKIFSAIFSFVGFFFSGGEGCLFYLKLIKHYLEYLPYPFILLVL